MVEEFAKGDYCHFQERKKVELDGSDATILWIEMVEVYSIDCYLVVVIVSEDRRRLLLAIESAIVGVVFDL